MQKKSHVVKWEALMAFQNLYTLSVLKKSPTRLWAGDLYRTSNEARGQLNLWMTRPLRSFGSNQVAFGGMILPLSAMSMICCMLTG